MFRSLFIALLLVLAPFNNLLAQVPINNASTAVQPLPNGYRAYIFGMTADAVRAALTTDSFFRYTGPDDAPMLNTPDNSGFEVDGVFFIRRAMFLFNNDRLYSITLELNPTFIDYFAVFNALQNKYGPVTDLNPQLAFWDNEAVLLTVERPLKVKYVDMTILNEIRDNFSVNQNLQVTRSAEFLQGL
jgi:hypothetical protein